MLKYKQSSKDLFWINSIFFLFFVFMYLLKLGKITVPIAIPAIARFIW